MNYTQKKSSCKPNQQKINKKSTKNTSIIEEKNISVSAFLGNREIGKRYKNIHKKYTRKHVAQYSLTVGVTENFIKEKKRVSSTRKNKGLQTDLSFAKKLKTINKTLCSCGRDVHFMNDKKIVDIKETDTTRRLKGLKSCGNNSACPVCASKLSSIRGNQLRDMMEAGRENGRSYMMVVSTVPHQPQESLEVTLNQVIDMSRYIFNQREYKNFKKLSGCRFVHGGLENMVSFKNGLVDWHPHKNYLLDFDFSIETVIKKFGLNNELELRMYVSSMMTKLGQKYLDSKGIKKELLKPFYQQEEKSKRFNVKAGISASLEFDDGYIAKWGLEAEMTSGIYKDGRFNGGSMHPFNLLDLIHNENKDTSEEFKYQCVKAFQEFVVASKGKWWFYFGRGAIAYYNENYNTELKVKKDEEELSTLDDDGELIYTLTHDEWLMFKPNPKKVGYALSLPTKKDVIYYFYDEIEMNRIKSLERRIE